jgi:manganese/zinc/iron transport system permease protein
VALLIMPGATARLWTQRLSTMLWLSTGFAIAGTLIGYWLSHANVLNTSAGAAIAAAGFASFVVSWLISPSQGLVSRWLARRRLVRKIALENLIKTIAELASSGDADVSSLRKELNWSDRDLSRVAARGVQRGWIAERAGRFALTQVGATRARRLADAHLAWEAYLQRELKLPTDHVHDAAEWIEHYLEEEKVNQLAGG